MDVTGADGGANVTTSTTPVQYTCVDVPEHTHMSHSSVATE